MGVSMLGWALTLYRKAPLCDKRKMAYFWWVCVHQKMSVVKKQKVREEHDIIPRTPTLHSPLKYCVCCYQEVGINMEFCNKLRVFHYSLFLSD